MKQRSLKSQLKKVTFLERENNDFASSSRDQHEQQHQSKDSIIDIKELEELKEILGPHACCIYKVPKHFRKRYEEAYTPQVISICPFHHAKVELTEMETQKLRYMLEFRKREGAAIREIEEFERFIQDNEHHIRNYYQENTIISKPIFVNMILCDAAFIIEFLLKNAEQESGI
ncbi:hypothetical protein Ddye_018214 [Dipteronia dyeriana]|uniref:Uncharacterized protein n=1 Tax=Dipteronia dyeriana TaxID=168575 RepID=A0AAD9UB36_9ROSI|nr:hypothetical protein Ddye_018214 [Dipteronia dyeriana]